MKSRSSRCKSASKNHQVLLLVDTLNTQTKYARRPHRKLAVILLIYLAVAATHSVVAPLEIGNDEWPHFQYTRFIAEHGRLPATLAERSNKEETGTKSDDPPLYHLISAATATLFGVEPARLLKPVQGEPRRQLADNVVVSHAFLVHSGHELFPWRGEVLLWHVGRAVSIFFGLVTVVLTYLTALTLLNSRRLALLAAAVIAFIPAFVFHTSVMSYDSLGAVFAALFLLAGIRAVRRPDQWRWWILLGLLAGLAMVTKYTSVLLPLEIVFLAGLAFWGHPLPDTTVSPPVFRRRFSAAAFRLIVAGLFVALATGWWFGFMVWNFNTIEQNGPVAGILEPLLVRGGNDSTAIRLTTSLLGQQRVTVDSPPPLRERHYPQLLWVFLQSFWAAPVAEKFVLPNLLAPLFTLAALWAGVGWWKIWRRGTRTARIWLLLLLFHTLLVMPLIVIRLVGSFDPLEAVQGRHVLLPAASAIAVLLVWGWQNAGFNAARWAVAGLLLWSVLGQVAWAGLRYPPPMPVWQSIDGVDSPMESIRPVGQTLLPGVTLKGATWHVSSAPALQVDLWWQARATMVQDYLVELSILDETGHLISYSVGQPVQGRYPTRAWEPDEFVKDTHYLPLVGRPAGSYSLQLRLLDRQARPLEDVAALELGPVDLPAAPPTAEGCAVWFRGRPTGNGLLAQPFRLRSAFTVISAEPPLLKPLAAGAPPQAPLVSRDKFHVFMIAPDWESRYQLAAGPTACREILVNVPPRQFTLPQPAVPLQVDFNRQIRLLGYDLPTRRINPGERLPLTLYWQALDAMGQDYRVFDNLLDTEQRRWGGYDRQARDGYSTLLWAPAEVITDPFGVPVDPAAPDGIYTLDIGWYRETTAGAESLPLTANGEPLKQTSVRLGPIKVGGPPPDVIVQNPQPQVTLNQRFGDEIILLGYDVNNEQLIMNNEQTTNSTNSINLTLYWRANAAPAADYTTFVHLRDAAGQTVTQKDQPPAAGRYPTSLWDSGEVIAGEVVLPLAGLPSGKYTPVIGLYRLDTGTRLPLDGGPNTELPLEQLTIGNDE